MKFPSIAVCAVCVLAAARLNAGGDFANLPPQQEAQARFESATSEDRDSSVSLIVPADAVMFTVTLANDEADTGARLRDLKAAIEVLRRNAPVGAQVVNQSAADVIGRFVQRPAEPDDRNLTRLSISVLVPLTEKQNEWDAIQAVSASVAKCTWPGRVTSRVWVHRIGVREPERYRAELLKKLKAQLDELHAIFQGNEKVEIAELQAPVQVMPFSDTQVEVVLRYRLAVTLQRQEVRRTD